MMWTGFKRRGVSGQPSPKSPAWLMTAAQDHFDAGRYREAIAIWLPLAQQGVARAQNNVGMCLIANLGVDNPDASAGVRWLLAAAHQGDAVAQRNLANAYFKGEGTLRDEGEAEAWYRRAAQQGDADAQDMLSWLLAESETRTPDYAESMRWAERAAAQGVAAAMARIGMFHHHALGVPRDTSAALQWWRRAAAADDGDGQAMLGAAYYIGQHVPRDPVRAYAWLRRARWNKSQLAERFIYATYKDLTPDQIAAAEALTSVLLETEATP